MSYLSTIMDDLGLVPTDIAKTAGVSTETVRRWQKGGKPRPRLAVTVARSFPKAIGAKLLREWGYSDKPMDYDVERSPADPLEVLAREVGKIRRLMQDDMARRDYAPELSLIEKMANEIAPEEES